MFRSALIIILLPTLLFYHSPFIKYLLGRFFYSTSGGGGLYAISLLFIILLLSFIFNKKIVIKKIPLLNLIMVDILFISGFLLNSYYFRYFSIDYTSRVIHWANNENSFNSILHTHILKPLNYILLHLLPVEHTFDLGKTLLSHINPYLLWILLLFYIVAIVTTIVVCHNLMFIHKNNLPIILLILLTAVIVTKSITDGGILNGATLIYLFLWHIFLLKRDSSSLSNFWNRHYYIILSLFAFNIFLGSLFRNFEDTNYGDIIFHYLVITISLYWDIMKKRFYLPIGISLFILYSIFYNYSINNPNKLSEKVHAISIDKYFNPIKKDMFNKSYKQIYEEFFDNLYKPKHTFLYKNSEEKSVSLVSVKIIPIKFDNNVKFTKNNFINVLEVFNDREGRIDIRFSIDIDNIFDSELPDFVKKNNYYVTLHIINRYLQQVGIHEYILITNEFKLNFTNRL
ncbi:MAG: hypothetical protein LDL13_02325 [Calditerrivibrio sp.]|nr:hypothetical protein [Calditerrivibrio sp.]